MISSKQIDRLEKTFDCELHSEYRTLLLNYPSALTRLFSDRASVQQELLSKFKDIYDINQTVRNPVRAADYPDWPQRYFIVGEDVGGNFYCLNTNSSKSTVYWWFHEENEFERFAPHLKSFIWKLYDREARSVTDELELR